MDLCRGVNVLNVDRDRAFTTRVERALAERDEFEVVTARESETALSTLESRAVDCLVSSYEVPGMDGLELLQEVRKEHPDLPFVLFAREGSEPVASRAISADAPDSLRQAVVAEGGRLGTEPDGATAEETDGATAEETDGGGNEQFAALAEHIERAVEEHAREGERERRFEALVDNLPGMAYRGRNGPDWPVDLVAGDVERLTGYRPAAFERGEVSIGTDLVHPDDAEPARAEIQSQLADGDTFEVTYRIRTNEGERRWVRERGQVVDRPADGPVVLEGFITDISERVEREQDLERYRQFIEHLPDMIAVLDEQLSVTDQSPPAPEFRYEPPRVPGEGGLFEYLHSDDVTRLRDALEGLVDEPDGLVTTECRARTASGEWRWIEARAQNYLGVEPVDGILVSIRDITERMEREQELARYGETLETLQETTQRLLDATDPEEVAQLTMTSIETVLEFEVAGMWLADDEQDRLEPAAVTDGSIELLEEIPAYTADDASLSWEAYSTNTIRVIDDMHDQEGRYNPETPIRSELIVPLAEYGLLNIGTTEPKGFSETDRTLVELWAGTVTTVLSRLEREQELREQEAEVARERDRLEAFASVVSHDLRNPLHVATSRLELLGDEVDSPHVPATRQALERMERLIEDLLVLAREGDTVHDPSLVDLGAVVEESWSTARTAGGTLVVDSDHAIRADRGRLVQVFENLFRNAVEHGSTGSEAEPDDAVEHGSTSNRTGSDDAVEHGGEAVTVTVGDLPDGFYVEDDGPGIPESERDRVFDSGYSRSADGNGLGLSIVRQIVTAHGWEIRVTEGREGGARFEITGVEVF